MTTRDSGLGMRDSADAALDRRDFLKVSAIAGGGMLLTVAVPASFMRRFGTEAVEFTPNVFVRILADNTVVVTVPKSEMGQGVRTTLSLIVAEELDADWEKVKVETSPFNPAVGSQGTGGSSSVRTTWVRLRSAGATARAMLVAAAAKEWGVPVAELRTEKSTVIHDATKRKIDYGALCEAATKQAVPADIQPKPRAQWRLLGKEYTGKDVDDIVHGRAKYGLDVRLPGMLFASIERTREFGATIASFDATAALKVPGVKKVVEVKGTGNDIGVWPGVAVLASSNWAAREGRKALQISWTSGAYAQENTDAYRAQMLAVIEKPGTELVNKLGDPDAVLAKATKVVSATYEVPFIAHATMEPMNATARVTADGIEVWAPTQVPDSVARAVSRTFGVPIENVRVNVTLIGGGFGRRLETDYAVEAALVAKEADAPVQVVWTREDDLRHDRYRPCAIHRVEASLGPDGMPEAWRQRFTSAAIGASKRPANPPANASGPPQYGGGESDGAANMLYRIPNRSCEFTLLSSGVPRGYWRAVHTTHSTFAVESFIDELAAAAGKDALEYRLALIDRYTLAQPAQDKDFPFNPDRLKAALRLAAEKIGWGKPLPKGHAIGIACGVDHVVHAAQAVEVSVSGTRITVERIVVAADSGPILNPNAARAQLEGGSIQGLSTAIRERITISNGGVDQGNFNTYRILRINEAPAKVEAYFVQNDDVHPTGLGETGIPCFAPALANAIARATGKRPRSLPFDLTVS